MVDYTGEKYSSEFDCTCKIVRSEGVLALWAGAGVNIFRSIVARIVLQCCCDLAKYAMRRDTSPRLSFDTSDGDYDDDDDDDDDDEAPG